MHETVAVGICLRQQFAYMKGKEEKRDGSLF